MGEGKKREGDGGDRISEAGAAGRGVADDVGAAGADAGEDAFGNGEAEPEQLISPLFNPVFLRSFAGDPAPACSLVNAVLRRVGLPEVGKVERAVADATLPSSVGLKAPRCDVVLATDEGSVSLEAQRKKVDYGAKGLFYSSKMLCESTRAGGRDDYSDLPRAVVVMLLEGHVMFPGGQPVTLCRMHWEREDGPVPGPGNVAIVLIELDKAAKEYNGADGFEPRDELDAWLYALACGYGDKGKVDAMSKVAPEIAEWAERYGIAVDDPEVKSMYKHYRESVMEWNSALSFARREGVEQGLEQGLVQGLVQGRDSAISSMRVALARLGVDEALVARAAEEAAGER